MINKKVKIKEKIEKIIKEHIINNRREYLIVTLIFILGLFLGIFWVNKSSEVQLMEVKNYVSSYIGKIQNIQKLDYLALFKNSVIQNIILAFTICFFGTTVIRITNCFWNYNV